jgi:hypothetical protein
LEKDYFLFIGVLFGDGCWCSEISCDRKRNPLAIAGFYAKKKRFGFFDSVLAS